MRNHARGKTELAVFRSAAETPRWKWQTINFVKCFEGYKCPTVLRLCRGLPESIDCEGRWALFFDMTMEASCTPYKHSRGSCKVHAWQKALCHGGNDPDTQYCWGNPTKYPVEELWVIMGIKAFN